MQIVLKFWKIYIFITKQNLIIAEKLINAEQH